MMNKILGGAAEAVAVTASATITTSKRLGNSDCGMRIRKGIELSFLNPQFQTANPQSKVPLEGVEPPPTYVDMDLNHARLPIPPQRLEHMIVSARHDSSQAARFCIVV